jgi:hypothetical protein
MEANSTAQLYGHRIEGRYEFLVRAGALGAGRQFYLTKDEDTGTVSEEW